MDRILRQIRQIMDGLVDVMADVWFYGGTLSSVQIFVPLGLSEQGFNEATLV